MIARRLCAKIAVLPATCTPVSSGPRWCRDSSAAATASRRCGALPRSPMKVSRPHIASSFHVQKVTEYLRTMGEQVPGAESHDPDYPEKLLLFLRSGWLDSAIP